MPGQYSVHVAADRRARGKLPKAERLRCLDPGYFARERDKDGKPSGKRARVYYCGYDTEEKKPIPPVTLTREGGEYAMHATGKDAVVRFRLLRGNLYLTQVDDSGPAKAEFDYHLFRIPAAGFEIFPLVCDDFASVTRMSEGELRTPDCEITSLEPIRGDLDAFAARVEAGTQPPLVILRRIP